MKLLLKNVEEFFEKLLDNINYKDVEVTKFLDYFRTKLNVGKYLKVFSVVPEVYKSPFEYYYVDDDRPKEYHKLIIVNIDRDGDRDIPVSISNSYKLLMEIKTVVDGYNNNNIKMQGRLYSKFCLAQITDILKNYEK